MRSFRRSISPSSLMLTLVPGLAQAATSLASAPALGWLVTGSVGAVLFLLSIVLVVHNKGTFTQRGLMINLIGFFLLVLILVMTGAHF